MSERLAIVLAAGKGTRMRSRLPKVLHQVAGRSSLSRVLDTCRAAGCTRLYVVVGHDAEQVRAAHADDPDVVWVEQAEQNGTGHAVLLAARQAVADLGERAPDDGNNDARVLVVYADNPVLRAETLERLLVSSQEGWGAVGVARLDDPGSLGRVVSAPDGQLQRIVEFADANAEERSIQLINAGQYAMPLPGALAHLEALQPHNQQGELYVTDAFVAAAGEGANRVECLELDSPDEALGINDRADLALVTRALVRRTLDRLMTEGVTVIDPERVIVEPEVEVAPDVILHPDVTLMGATRVASGVVLHQGSWVRDSELGEDVEVLPYSVLDGAVVGAGSSVGPFARLRPATVLGENAKVGNFVEVKKSTLGDGTKASHLAYIGDATLGSNVNIGAGVVTCNYDGVRKHETVVGDDAFVGSDTMLVAPVTVGSGALTAAGSVITKNVPDDSIGIGRGSPVESGRPGEEAARARLSARSPVWQ